METIVLKELAVPEAEVPVGVEGTLWPRNLLTTQTMNSQRGTRLRGRRVGAKARMMSLKEMVNQGDNLFRRRLPRDEGSSRNNNNKPKLMDIIMELTRAWELTIVLRLLKGNVLILVYFWSRRSRTLPSKSTIGTNTTPTGDGLTDSQTLKRLLKPIPSAGSVVTSPEMSRRVYHHDGYISGDFS